MSSWFLSVNKLSKDFMIFNFFYQSIDILMHIFLGKWSLDNGYLDNFVNGFSNKYEN
jgi:hypothetical protein